MFQLYFTFQFPYVEMREKKMDGSQFSACWQLYRLALAQKIWGKLEKANNASKIPFTLADNTNQTLKCFKQVFFSGMVSTHVSPTHYSPRQLTFLIDNDGRVFQEWHHQNWDVSGVRGSVLLLLLCYFSAVQNQWANNCYLISYFE